MDRTQLLIGVAVALFSLGLVGVIVRRNVLVMLMCMELMLNGVNLSLVTFAQQTGDDGRRGAGLPGLRRRHRRDRASRSRSCCCWCAHKRTLDLGAYSGPEGLDDADRDRPAAAARLRSLNGFARDRPRRQPRRQRASSASSAAACRSPPSRSPSRRLLDLQRRRLARRSSRSPTRWAPIGDSTLRDRLLLRPPHRGDGADRHRRRLADPRLLDRLHEGRHGLRALLRVPEPVPLLHAAAGARPLAARALRRLGRRRASPPTC